MPSIAVIMPAFNAERYIEETLDSVAMQERLPDEIVIVDDGSTDRTVEIVSGWKARHDLDVKLIKQKNGGAPAARNTAIRNTQADLLAILDADDLWLPIHLRSLESGFIQYPELVMCFGDAQSFDENGVLRDSYLDASLVGRLPYDKYGDLRVIRSPPYRAMINNTGIATCSQLMSRKAVVEIGLFDEDVPSVEDLDLPLRLSRIGPFGYFSNLVGRMRRHESNTTHKRHRLRQLGFQIKVHEKMLALRDELSLTDEEIHATQDAAQRTAKRILRISSEKGPKVFWRHFNDLRRRGHVMPLSSAKDLLRSFLHIGNGARSATSMLD